MQPQQHSTAFSLGSAATRAQDRVTLLARITILVLFVVPLCNAQSPPAEPNVTLWSWQKSFEEGPSVDFAPVEPVEEPSKEDKADEQQQALTEQPAPNRQIAAPVQSPDKAKTSFRSCYS